MRLSVSHSIPRPPFKTLENGLPSSDSVRGSSFHLSSFGTSKSSFRNGLDADGEFDEEDGASGIIVSDTDISVVVGDDGIDDGQSQSRSALFCGIVGFEELSLVFFGNPAPVVAHLKANHLEFFVITRLDLDLSSLIDGGKAILDEIDHHPLYLIPVEVKDGKVVWDKIEPDILVGLLKEDKGLLNDFVETIRGGIRSRHPGKVGEFVDHPLQFFNLLHNRLRAFIEDGPILSEFLQVSFPQPLCRELNRG